MTEGKSWYNGKVVNYNLEIIGSKYGNSLSTSARKAGYI